MKVDFYRHELTPDDAAAIAEVLATPFLTTGAVAKQVEEQLAAYFDLPHAILVNSWTNGALALLLAMDLKPGDEVVIPAMTFIATANVVELAGGTPVFVDCDPGTLLITPESIRPHVSERTRAVMPVHMYGQMADVTGIREMLDAHPRRAGHIALIEDCAHCFEGQREGYRPGRHSDAAVFSFYATKNITCGEGGAIVMSDEGWFRRTLETRLHGMSAIAVDRFAGGRYNHWDMNRLGTKANLPDLLAALLPRQIQTIDARLERRQAVANRYRDALADGPLRLVTQVQACKSAEHIFPIGIPRGQRDAAIAMLNEAGIAVTVNYRPVPSMRYYSAKYPGADAACPESALWGEETLTLPFYPTLPRDQQDYVIDTIRTRIYPLIEAA